LPFHLLLEGPFTKNLEEPIIHWLLYLRPAGTDTGILAEVSNTDFLHVISLFHTRDRRRVAEAVGKQGKDLPAVSGNRQTLLNHNTLKVIASFRSRSL
jgi:hypothetical protein